MKNVRVLWLVIAVAALLPLQAMAMPVIPFVNITTSSGYTELADALNEVGDNETIEIVQSGTYQCYGLAITRNNVTLRASDGVNATLNGDFNWSGYCLSISGHDVTISGMEITRAINPIRAIDATNLTLENLEVSHANGNGIHTQYADGITVDDVEFTQITSAALYINTATGATISGLSTTNSNSINKCIEVRNASNVTIDDSYLGCWNVNGVFDDVSGLEIHDVEMVHGNYGLYFDSCNEAMISDITSHNVVNANISLTDSDDCEIKDSHIEPGSRESISLTRSEGTYIHDVTMHCTGGSSNGISASSSSGTVIRYCEVKSAGYDGISLSDSPSSTVENTFLCSNRKGILLTNSSQDCTIKNNTIQNNKDSGISVNWSQRANIRNNIVVNNGKTYWTWGVQCDWFSSVTLTYNDVWNNRANYSNCTAGTGSISVDPLLNTGCAEASLKSGSPCIDAGDPNDPVGSEPNPNGDRINMGANGGTDKAATTSQMEVSIAEAAARGWVNLYCYPWENVQYNQVSGMSNASNAILAPWTGFWVIVYQDVDLVFPASQNSSSRTMEKTLENSWYYLISVPLSPSNGDPNAVLGDDLGSGLHDGTSDQKWRVSKWDVDQDKYIRYTGSGSIPTMIPGRGYWVRHIYDEAKTISVSGSSVRTNTDYALKLKCDGRETFHMVGNPFPYDFDWRTVKVRVPMSEDIQAGKIANVSDFNDLETWEAELKLSSTDGTYVDENNMAGIVLSDDDYSYMLNAVDMPPFSDEYVRLYLMDPNDTDGNVRSLDYRGPFDNDYYWDIVLTTNLDAVETKLDFGNLTALPDIYKATLTAPDETEIELSGDLSIPVSLTSSTETVYRLTVSRKVPLAVSDQAVPQEFGIAGVSPNPFNPTTTIEYMTSGSGNVSLSIYNIAGQKIATLQDGAMSKGTHSIVWNAAGNSSGVYFVVLNANGMRSTRKITLMR